MANEFQNAYQKPEPKMENLGPAQVLHIIEEGETEPAFKDRSVKIRDHEELLDREVKFIQPAADTENAGKYIFKIWIYPAAA